MQGSAVGLASLRRQVLLCLFSHEGEQGLRQAGTELGPGQAATLLGREGLFSVLNSGG